jgi:Phosphatidylinositol 3- and 4-kinase
MNEVLSQDAACCKRNLSLTTYQVVPMTSMVGMIEWLDNTMPLKSIIANEVARKFPTSQTPMGTWYAKFERLIKKGAALTKKDPSHSEVYGAHFLYVGSVVYACAHACVCLRVCLCDCLCSVRV